MRRGNTHSRGFFLFTACLALIFGSSQVQAQTPEGFDEWRKKILRLCDWEIPLDGVRIRWRTVDTRKTTPEQLQGLKRDAVASPNSSAQFELQLAQAAAEGKAWIESEMWIYDGQWRINWDKGGGGIYDHVLRTDRSWSMTGERLTYFDREGPRSGEVRLGHGRATSETEFRNLLTGGLSSFMTTLETFAHAVPKVDGKIWTVDTPLPADSIGSLTHLLVSGQILGNGRFTIDRAEVTIDRPDRPVRVRTVRYVADGWIEHPAFDTGIATVVDEFGQLDFPRTFRFVSAETITRSDFDRVTQPPALGELDAIRGTVTAMTLEDYRDGRVVKSSRKDDGSAEVLRVPAPGANTSQFSWLLGSLVILAGVVVLLIVLKVKHGSP